MSGKKAWLICLLACCCVVGTGLSAARHDDRPLPFGKALTDTIEVGKVFSYALSYRHAPSVEVFFPDSTHNFAPFRLVSQQYFTTYTDKNGSLDSTVYNLVSFEVAPRLELSLPVFLLTKNDCTAVYSKPDTVFVRLLADRQKLDSLSLLTDSQPVPLGLDINYSVLLLSLAIGGMSVFSIYWFFGRAISRQWQLFQLQRRHRDFVRAFNRYNPETPSGINTSNAENAVILWKKYLQRILKKPFATYTTKEILDNFQNERLALALKEIDRSIYGQIPSTGIHDAMQSLRDVAQNVYRNKRREIIDITGDQRQSNPLFSNS